jgi:hypothetical protein
MEAVSRSSKPAKAAPRPQLMAKDPETKLKKQPRSRCAKRQALYARTDGGSAMGGPGMGTRRNADGTQRGKRLNEEIRRRTHVVRIFPNGESCLRLVRALAVEIHENWLEQHRYLNMGDLR